MANEWVDFKAVKESVTMQMVLDHYDVNWLRQEKQEMVGRCPIHRAEKGSGRFMSVSPRISSIVFRARPAVTFWISWRRWRSVRCATRH